MLWFAKKYFLFNNVLQVVIFEYNCNMDISFTDLKEREIVNVYDGKKLGRVIDILFDSTSGSVRGIIVPGDKKLFHKSDDIFVPLDRLKKIGDDVILVSLQTRSSMTYYEPRGQKTPVREMNNNYDRYVYREPQMTSLDKSYLRYRPVSSKKYK